MSKILITSGCSFSECVSPWIDTWPRHLYNLLKNHDYTNHISCAIGCQGNGLISRRVEYEVIKALKTYKSEDILVGVMWSSSSRFDYRCEDNSLLSWDDNDINDCHWHFNPIAFVDGAPKNWVVGNLHWNKIEFSTYLKYFHSDIGAAITSLEHILRTQYFLRINKIPYFFTNFVDENIVEAHLENNEEIKYLIDQLDTSQYLPTSSERRWLLQNSKYKEQYEKQCDQHPQSHHHQEFTEQVIYPWLIGKYLNIF